CIQLLIAIGLTPFIVDKADQKLGSLAYKKEAFIKFFPACAGRLAWYGVAILMRSFRQADKWPFAGREDRVSAIDKTPRSIKLAMVFIYLGFFISALIALVILGSGMLLDNLAI